MSIVDDIRNQATNNRTVIQSSEAAGLSKIFNQMFYLDKSPQKEAKFVKHVMTRGLETSERVGMHASSLIVSDRKFCLRAMVLSLIYRQLQGAQINVNLRRIFEEGNSVHEKWQRLFLRAGYAEISDLDATQFNPALRVSYTPDIIATIPKWYDGQFVVEIKSVNTYQFKKMAEKGAPHPSASKQCQWYMHLTNLKRGVVLCEDKNNQQFLIEVYDYDVEHVKPYIARCHAVKKAYINLKRNHKMVARPKDATSYDCKRCHECNMRDACWNTGEGRVLL